VPAVAVAGFAKLIPSIPKARRASRDIKNHSIRPGREGNFRSRSGSIQPVARRGVPVTAEESDLVLVKRVQRGDKSAFDLLVRKYQHKVVKLVLRYVRNPAEAEDIAQEAFIKAYRALPQFRGDSAFYTWMYRIAINTAKNSLASRDRSPIAYDLDLTDPEESHSVQTKLQDPDTPEGMALTEEIRGIVNSAIEGLPEELKTAIVLRELDGLSYEEIAAAMECPVGTVRSRIFRAREAIDKRLREVFEGGLGRTEEMV